MTHDEGESIRVLLAGIQGGINVLTEKVESANRLNEERLKSIREDVADLKRSTKLNEDEINALKGVNKSRDGERQGIALSGRMLWGIIGMIVAAIGAGLLRHFGL